MEFHGSDVNSWDRQPKKLPKAVKKTKPSPYIITLLLK